MWIELVEIPRNRHSNEDSCRLKTTMQSEAEMGGSYIRVRVACFFIDIYT